MCGIAGLFDPLRRLSAEDLQAAVARMTRTLHHRGPDDAGIWTDEAAGLGLGSRRLAIIDLSPEGHQPMRSSDGRYVIAFNGEIYNFQSLREPLERLGHGFRGHSDTEVMLAAISEWGLELALQRFNGMFGFALWDRKERSLHLVRDRLGEKPVYYGWVGGSLLFGSELKALRVYPRFAAEIDRDALAIYLRHNYVPAPYSIYRGIFKLPPGTALSVTPADVGRTATPVPYWSAKSAAERGAADLVTASVDECATLLDTLLRDAVKLRMQADVPLGAFLSGGIDSSTVVAMMQAQSTRAVQTFTIGFHEGDYDEAKHAKAVADHLGTDHTEVYVTPSEAMAAIPRLPQIYDEPFADSSQIPTFLVAQIARRRVTVALSGDGGDELFGGYIRYGTGRNLWSRIGWLPTPLRRVVSSLISHVPVTVLDSAFDWLAPVVGRHGRPGSIGDKLHKVSEILAVSGPEELYRRLVSHWKDPEAVALGASEPPTVFTDREAWAALPDFLQRMMYFDTVSYLPDDILVKVDRATMAVSLEARLPLLDHRVVEFAWRTPVSLRVRNGATKWLLRQVLYRYVPSRLVERPKMGFGVPIDAWLRGPLREWAEALFDERRLRQEGFFDPHPIREKWSEHLAGRRKWHYYLWDVLMFQAWLEHERRVDG